MYFGLVDWKKAEIGRSAARRLGPLGVIFAGMIAVLVAGSWPTAVAAHDYTLGDLSIGHIWAPPTDKDATGAAVYGPILNRGEGRDYLLGASSPKADYVRLRRKTDSGVGWPDRIALTPGKPVSLADWRVHIWLEGLKKPLAKGEDFPLTLEFARAGTIDVTVVVENAAGH